MGGGVYYNLNRPDFQNNSFSSNIAQYGPNIASYAVRIYQQGTQETQVDLSDVASGLQYNGTVNLTLVDYDNQTMVLENAETVKITPITQNSGISSLDYAKFTAGQASFTNLVLTSKPGSENIEYSLTSRAISQTKIGVLATSSGELDSYSSKLNVNFRFCKPGEIQTSSDVCEECSYGTYSLDWNSTSCIQCMNSAECLGKTEISVNEGFWRESTNSTTIVECPREKSCFGGYVEGQEHPVECAAGYEGFLCTDCKILNGTKYQPLSNFECVK